MSVVETAVNSEVDRLRAENERLAFLNERLTRRVLTKDAEFQKERNTWKRERAKMKEIIASLRRGKA